MAGKRGEIATVEPARGVLAQEVRHDLTKLVLMQAAAARPRLLQRQPVDLTKLLFQRQQDEALSFRPQLQEALVVDGDEQEMARGRVDLAPDLLGTREERIAEYEAALNLASTGLVDLAIAHI